MDDYINGVIDSLQFAHIFTAINKSKKIVKCLMESMFLNGLLFLGGISILNFLLTYVSDGSVYNLIILIKYLWIFPVYLVSSFVNIFIFRDITNELKNRKQNSNLTLKEMLSSQMYLLLLILILLIISMLVIYLPYIGPIIYYILTSFMYGFYILDYKWSLNGYSINRKLYMMEHRFLYLCGFGTLFTMITHNMSFFTAYGIYTLLAPYLLIIVLSFDRQIGKFYIPIMFLPIFMITKIDNLIKMFYSRD